MLARKLSMNVKLIGFLPNPEKMPAMAAKLTHSKIKPINHLKKSLKQYLIRL